MSYIKSFLVFVFIVSALHISCKKFLEIEKPINKNTREAVFASTSSAVSAMTGIYVSMSNGSFAVGTDGIPIATGVLADELVPTPSWLNPDIYINNLNGGDNTKEIWNSSYKLLFKVNSIIEGVSNSKGIPEKTKNILVGEAKFVRAFIYYYLVNLYGDIPLVITSDITQNSNIGRTAKEMVYNQIIRDLLDAQIFLNDDYLNTDLLSVTNEKVRPNRGAATALLARVYLFTKDWVNAEIESTKVISDSSHYKLDDYDKVFLKNSNEAIWQLQPNILNPEGVVNAVDGRLFVSPYEPTYSISTFLESSFEPGDLRKDKWTSVIDRNGNTYRIPYKYKIGEKMTPDPQPQEEYTMVMRLAELYLIRAEARTMQGKITGVNSAAADLNVIRTRAGLSDVSPTDQDNVIDLVLQERRVELFTEWGHRWIDIKRLNRIDQVMSQVTPLKGGTWSSSKSLLPIPFEEFKTNPALKGQQNPGYTEQP